MLQLAVGGRLPAERGRRHDGEIVVLVGEVVDVVCDAGERVVGGEGIAAAVLVGAVHETEAAVVVLPLSLIGVLLSGDLAGDGSLMSLELLVCDS